MNERCMPDNTKNKNSGTFWKAGEIMYAVIAIVQWPDGRDPFCREVQSASTIEEAVAKANAMNEELLDEYGEDYFEEATPKNLCAEGTNGETSWFVFIKKFT